jgi:sialate O-acetylesterase
VLIGDVWICSGQSNMEWGMWGVNNSPQEIAAADHPQLRLFTVPKKIATRPQEVPGGQWQVCNPETVAGFSAVGFFFGRDLQQAIDVPIGLIHTSWGGTVAEAWTSAEALETMEDFKPAVAQFRQLSEAIESGNDKYEEQLALWWRENDPGSAAEKTWADPGLDAADWKTMNLPAGWEQAGLPDFDGVVWFRTQFDLPEAAAGKEATLGLGPIDDIDTTWVNGLQVGGGTVWNQPRVYKIPAGALKAGRNTVAIRVLDTGGGGGVFGQADQLKVEPAGGQPISLAGAWRYKVGAALADTKPAPQRLDNNPNVTTVLYNGMIAPLVPFGVKGAIWYQGESNAGRPAQYRTLLPTMIRDWRARFDVGDFPFFIVQLANFMGVQQQPVESGWAELREAQLLTALNDPNCGLAVAIDIGEANDIHPKNKQDVGARLALAARGIAYGQSIEYSGPEFKSMEVTGGKARLHFEHVGGGLVARGGEPLKGFAIAGADKRFVFADAKIDGDTVVVSSPDVAEPVAVRYGWANNPVCNLYNKAGLPASPFRTDVEGP